MCPNCGRAFPPNAIWMVNPERYFCTCPKYSLTSIPTASQIAKIREWIGEANGPTRKVEATRPSEV